MLREILKAQRPDLLDGFPLKAAFKALSTEGSQSFKLAYMNELLANEGIEVIITKDSKFLMPGFKESGIAGGMTYSDGSIEVKVTSKFFDAEVTPLDRALRFQSITAHELVHRQQFATEILHDASFKADDELTSIQYLNDPHELEAMAAEVAHDSLTSKYSGSTFAQPRLDDLVANAKHFRPESMTQFRAAVRTMQT